MITRILSTLVMMGQVVNVILVEFAHLQSEVADFPSQLRELMIHYRNDLAEPFIHPFFKPFYPLIVL